MSECSISSAMDGYAIDRVTLLWTLAWDHLCCSFHLSQSLNTPFDATYPILRLSNCVKRRTPCCIHSAHQSSRDRDSKMSLPVGGDFLDEKHIRQEKSEVALNVLHLSSGVDIAVVTVVPQIRAHQGLPATSQAS